MRHRVTRHRVIVLRCVTRHRVMLFNNVSCVIAVFVEFLSRVVLFQARHKEKLLYNIIRIYLLKLVFTTVYAGKTPSRPAGQPPPLILGGQPYTSPTTC